MTIVQIMISDALAKEAAAEGLPEPGSIEAILRERLLAGRVAKMQAAWGRVAAVWGRCFDVLGQDLDPAVVAGMKANVPHAADQAFMAACIRQFPDFAVPKERLAASTRPAIAIIGDKDPFKAAVARMDACMGRLDVVVNPGRRPE